MSVEVAGEFYDKAQGWMTVVFCPSCGMNPVLLPSSAYNHLETTGAADLLLCRDCATRKEQAAIYQA